MFQFQGEALSLTPDEELCPWILLRLFDAQCTRQLNKVDIWPTRKKYCPRDLALAPPRCPQLQIPSAAHAEFSDLA